MYYLCRRPTTRNKIATDFQKKAHKWSIDNILPISPLDSNHIRHNILKTSFLWSCSNSELDGNVGDNNTFYQRGGQDGSNLLHQVDGDLADLCPAGSFHRGDTSHHSGKVQERWGRNRKSTRKEGNEAWKELDKDYGKSFCCEGFSLYLFRQYLSLLMKNMMLT